MTENEKKLRQQIADKVVESIYYYIWKPWFPKNNEEADKVANDLRLKIEDWTIPLSKVKLLWNTSNVLMSPYARYSDAVTEWVKDLIYDFTVWPVVDTVKDIKDIKEAFTEWWEYSIQDKQAKLAEAWFNLPFDIIGSTPIIGAWWKLLSNNFWKMWIKWILWFIKKIAVNPETKKFVSSETKKVLNSILKRWAATKEELDVVRKEFSDLSKNKKILDIVNNEATSKSRGYSQIWKDISNSKLIKRWPTALKTNPITKWTTKRYIEWVSNFKEFDKKAVDIQKQLLNKWVNNIKKWTVVKEWVKDLKQKVVNKKPSTLIDNVAKFSNLLYWKKLPKKVSWPAVMWMFGLGFWTKKITDNLVNQINENYDRAGDIYKIQDAIRERWISNKWVGKNKLVSKNKSNNKHNTQKISSSINNKKNINNSGSINNSNSFNPWLTNRFPKALLAKSKSSDFKLWTWWLWWAQWLVNPKTWKRVKINWDKLRKQYWALSDKEKAVIKLQLAKKTWYSWYKDMSDDEVISALVWIKTYWLKWFKDKIKKNYNIKNSWYSKQTQSMINKWVKDLLRYKSTWTSGNKWFDSSITQWLNSLRKRYKKNFKL